jgi:ElaB/YqjD/DUF883 family membrane-anchored ribosome-binding protein
MTEQLPPKYSSSDVPDFATYPASPAEAAREIATGARYSHEDTDLEERARKIGWALGKLVNRLDEVKAQAREKINYIPEDAKESIESAKEGAREKFSNAKQQAQQKFGEARYRASRLRRRAVNDYPLQLILAAGIGGILAGAGLRAWRESRG